MLLKHPAACVAALVLLTFGTSASMAAAPTNADEALGRLTVFARGKVKQAHWKKIYQDERPDFIVEFKDETPDDIATETLPLADKLARRRETFERTKGRVMGRFKATDLETRTAYAHLPMAHLRAKNRDALLALMESPEVLRIHANLPHKAVQSPGANLTLIGQPSVVASGHTGAGTTVAVLDTGLDYTNAAFGPCTAPGQPASCRVRASLDMAPDDGALDADGHGTNVAGIVAATAPGVRLIGLDVFTGWEAWSAEILKGINWAIANRLAHNIVAINLSLGEGGPYPGDCADNYAQAAFQQARLVGIVPVVASGNNAFADGIASPACAPSAVAVGAVYDTPLGGLDWSICADTVTSTDRVTCFSNAGTSLDLLAPGVDIPGAGWLMSGTSQAAPHVAGAAAVLRGASLAPALPVDQFVATMASTGVPITDHRNGLVRPRINLSAAATATRATAFAASTQVYSNFSLQGEKAFVADVNGDRKGDLITFAGGNSGDVHVALSNGTGFGPALKVHDWFAAGNEKPFVADVNGDGKADLISFAGADNGDVYVALSTGSGFSASQKVHDWFAPFGQIPFVADVNGDGKADLIGFSQDVSARVWVSFGTGNGFGPSQALLSGFAPLGEKPFVADFNGDGKADLLTFVGGTSGKVYVALSTGTGFAPPKLVASGFSPGAQVPFAADINGDRKADLISFTKGDSADVWVALSTGTGTATPVKVQEWFAPGSERPFAADVNGDGRADLIDFAGGSAGKVYSALSNAR